MRYPQKTIKKVASLNEQEPIVALMERMGTPRFGPMSIPVENSPFCRSKIPHPRSS